MTENTCRIICASAGTGKTYRLSLEYITLILEFYGKPDFSLDSILVLTFTRKATAEIRERIVAHLELLTSAFDLEKYTELRQNLRKLVPSAQPDLTMEEKNLLLSAKQEIICDKSHLQVMTIDAYINHIFRNIVRPLRNIERYEIDTEAVEKRMPLLLNHLMKPEFRERLNRLLTRKVSRSLDYYREFFSSLVKQRWLYYLITQRTQKAASESNRQRLCELSSQNSAEQSLAAFLESLQTIIEQVHEISLQKPGLFYTELLRTEFSKLVSVEGCSPAALMQRVKALSSDRLEKLLGILNESIWNGNRIRANKYPQETVIMQTALEQARRHLADYLLSALYLPEQQEIMEIWKLILEEYDRLIYRDKKLTYDDISWFTFEALFSQDPPFMNPEDAVTATEFYQFLSHRTRFLLIDEFQDTSLIQFNILKPIIEEITSGEGSKPFGGLIVVGDEKQSIFGWRGGERDLLLNLQDIFPAISEVRTERLSECWRCGPSLMQFINSVFQHQVIHNYLNAMQMSWEYQMISSAVAVKKEPGTLVELCIRNYSPREAESGNTKEIIADFVNRMVRPAWEKDKSGSIAILCRKGNELLEIQQALDEAGITSLYQPDRSVIQHRLISPLLAWLRFVAWGDWTDFAAFLRSDYLRLKSAPLKTVLQSISRSLEQSRERFTPPDFTALPLVEKLYQQAQEQKTWQASRICRQMAETYLLPDSTSERDYLNLHHWLDRVADWELNSTENSLPEMLAWVRENARADDFKQVSISGEDSLQLLTFHKAKGLQFRRVFVFYNLSGKHRNATLNLQWAVQYADKDFHKLSDFGISFHYQKILQASSLAYLWEAGQNRELLEEMNNLYVAFTRAETKLHLYFCYNGKDSWQEYLEKHADSKLPVLVCDAVKQSFGSAIPDERGIYSLASVYPEPAENKAPTAANASKPEASNSEPNPGSTGAYQSADPASSAAKTTLEAYPRFVHHRLLEPDELLPADKPRGQNLKQQWLETKPNLAGDLLHLYFSFIKCNQPEEHRYAGLKCLFRFGAIFPRDRIDELTLRARRACEANLWLFEDRWDRIFTEQEIIHNGKLLRLDRLQLNTQQKQALIVDYKSGEVHDPEQLTTYVKALAALPALQDFAIETRIVQI